MTGSPPSSSGASSAPAKRACDACHRRKVKCIGAGPACKHCLQAGLKCTFMKQPQKKGPKGSRAKVISELRETQRFDGDSVSWKALVPTPATLSPVSPMFPSVGGASLSPELINICIDYFFIHVYPTQPIIHRESLRQSVAIMYQSPEALVLIETLVAYMLIQPKMNLPPHLIPYPNITSASTLGTALLADALDVRKTYNYLETATATTVTTSFFFFGCYFCLEKHNSAWFYLREATTLAVILNMHQESHYAQGDPIAVMLKRRLFWILFLTERAYALQQQKPLTLHPTISLPTIDEDSDEAVEISGFIQLIHLFKPFDDTFVGLWNQSVSKCDPNLILALQNQLFTALPHFLSSTETQAVDLRTTQTWLRIMVWQLSISHRLLSSGAQNAALTFQFPIHAARELITETRNYSQQAMEVHGIGLVSKMFDIACTLVDVMSCVPLETATFEVGPRDYLNHFIQLMSQLRGGQERYLPLLLAKTSDSLPQAVPTWPGSRPRLPSSVEFPSQDAEITSTTSSSANSIDTPSEEAGGRSEYSADLPLEPAPTSVPASFQFTSSTVSDVSSYPSSHGPGFMR